MVLATRHAIPALYSRREFVAMGGLISYGPNIDEMYRTAASTPGAFSRGEKPSDLPIQLPTKFEC